MNEQLVKELSKKLKIKNEYIENVLNMLKDNATDPLMPHYRKKQTGGLDEGTIKEISDEYHYLEELEKRKEDVIRLNDKQGILTEDLKNQISHQTSPARVEDLYRPFKQ